MTTWYAAAYAVDSFLKNNILSDSPIHRSIIDNINFNSSNPLPIFLLKYNKLLQFSDLIFRKYNFTKRRLIS